MLAVLFSAFVVLGAKLPLLGKPFVYKAASDDFGGDLYNSCMIDRFRGKIEKKDSRDTATLNTADVLVLGDSFANSALDSYPVAEELARTTGLKVYSIRAPGALGSPMASLQQAGYRPNGRRAIILVTAERSSLNRAHNYHRKEVLANALQRPAVRRFLGIKNLILVHTDVSYFLTHNRWVHPFYHALLNWRYRLSGRIDDNMVGAFSKDPPVLYLKEAVGFDRKKKSPEEILAMTESIALLAKQLRETYDLSLFYVIVPNKYSVYHEYVHDGYVYDDFIPRVVRQLKGKGVDTMDLYTRYMSYRKNGGSEWLYYPSDTHWTPLGKSMMIEECVSWLKKQGIAR